jgi:hypothetical protein
LFLVNLLVGTRPFAALIPVASDRTDIRPRGSAGFATTALGATLAPGKKQEMSQEMSNDRQVGFFARVALLGLASALASAASAHAAVADADVNVCTGCGSRASPVEVILPFELQAQFLHSLPIAGLLVTPDAIAERVLLNPRLRATIGVPSTGKGASGPVFEPGVGGTRADPPD